MNELYADVDSGTHLRPFEKFVPTKYSVRYAFLLKCALNQTGLGVEAYCMRNKWHEKGWLPVNTHSIKRLTQNHEVAPFEHAARLSDEVLDLRGDECRFFVFVEVQLKHWSSPNGMRSQQGLRNTLLVYHNRI